MLLIPEVFIRSHTLGWNPASNSEGGGFTGEVQRSTIPPLSNLVYCILPFRIPGFRLLPFLV